MDHLSEVRPIADAVADVLEDLPLSLVSVMNAEQAVPESRFSSAMAPPSVCTNPAEFLVLATILLEDSKKPLRTTRNRAKELLPKEQGS